jgi:hypothetical protein
MIAIETVPGISGGGMGKRCREGKFNYNMFDTL